MAQKQTSNLNLELFDELEGRGFSPVSLDHKGDNSIDIENADVIRFEYKVDDENYGPVWASIDDSSLTMYINDKVKGAPGFNDFLKFMKSWIMAFRNWTPKNTDHLKSDMKKRATMKKKETLGEGYYPLGKKASYSDNVPQVKIILQHTRPIEEGEQRFRNVAKIFVENTNGERFLLPTNRPGLARVYARHIAEGGTPYDERGHHINSLVEEYTKMAGFVRATKNSQFNESAQKLVNEGLTHYSNLRETLTRMTTRRGYSNYFESYTPVLNEETDDTTSLNELFVQETLDPRIESVMPILKRLQKNITEMNEVNELAEWAESITEVEDETTKTLAEPAEEMLDEAPGAETLKHNQDTEKSNLKAFDLEEAGVEETKLDLLKKIRKKFNRIEEGPADAPEHEHKDADDKRWDDAEEVDENLDANEKRVNTLGPTEKVKNNNIGKLVGESELDRITKLALR